MRPNYDIVIETAKALKEFQKTQPDIDIELLLSHTYSSWGKLVVVPSGSSAGRRGGRLLYHINNKSDIEEMIDELSPDPSWEEVIKFAKEHKLSIAYHGCTEPMDYYWSSEKNVIGDYAPNLRKAFEGMKAYVEGQN